MAVSYTRLVATGDVNATQHDFFTAPSKSVVALTLVNHTAGAVTIEISHVDAGGTNTGDEFIIIPSTSLESKGRIVVRGIVMETSDILSGIAGSATSISYKVQGAKGLA